MKRYLITIALGLIGMFIAHFLLFLLSASLRLNFMPYVIAYPVVYISIVLLLTSNNPAWWLSNTICILLIPFIYWYSLLWAGGKLRFADAMKLGESSGMLLILPLTFLLVMFVSLIIFKRRQIA